MRSAASTAPSTVVTASPGDTGMPKRANSCLPWYSNRSTMTPTRRLRTGARPDFTSSRCELGLPGVERLLEPLVDGCKRRARREERGDTDLLERGDVVIGDDAAAEHHHVAEAPLAQQLQHPAEQRHVRAREQREPDGVGVLLQRRLRHLLGRLVQAGVDDLEAGVAQRPRDHLGAPVVTIEARLRDDDAISPFHEHPSGDGRRCQHAADLRKRYLHGIEITQTSVGGRLDWADRRRLHRAMASERNDLRLLLITGAAVIVAGLLVAAGIFVATNTGKPNSRKPLPLGDAGTLQRSTAKGGPVYIANPFGGTGFLLALEHNKLVALLPDLPAETTCRVRWKGSINSFVDCHNDRVGSTQLARFHTDIPSTGSQQGVLLVDLRRREPPPAG